MALPLSIETAIQTYVDQALEAKQHELDEAHGQIDTLTGQRDEAQAKVRALTDQYEAAQAEVQALKDQVGLHSELYPQTADL